MSSPIYSGNPLAKTQEHCNWPNPNDLHSDKFKSASVFIQSLAPRQNADCRFAAAALSKNERSDRSKDEVRFRNNHACIASMLPAIEELKLVLGCC